MCFGSLSETLLLTNSLADVTDTLIIPYLIGNDISKVEGLEGLQQLRELVLDRNKIKVI